MKAARSPQPPLAAVDAALWRTTERLALELHSPGECAPGWNALEWSVARAVSAMQGITVLLANRLRWRGPASWQEFLGAQCDLARQRDSHIETLLARIDDSLRADGIAAVGLKGSALRRLGLYHPGERPMGDIDLLTDPGDGHRVAQALQRLDYILAFETRRHVVYVPRVTAPVSFGEHPQNALKIEVHAKVAEPLPIEEVAISQRWLEGAKPGINPYPCRAELMRHLLLHAAGNMRAHALRQIQLHDIALLAVRFEEVDWRTLLSTPDSQGGAWWMFPPLALAARYYPGCIAPPLLAEFAERCPRILRRMAAHVTLTAVSWSNLRIAAFPGIYWSRSSLEALLFARSRIFPSQVALAELRLAVEAQPAVMQARWYDVSHLRRILRWTLGRAPRVQTLLSLEAARAIGDTSLNV